jgi:hypothetical protein
LACDIRTYHELFVFSQYLLKFGGYRVAGLAGRPSWSRSCFGKVNNFSFTVLTQKGAATPTSLPHVLKTEDEFYGAVEEALTPVQKEAFGAAGPIPIWYWASK